MVLLDKGRATGRTSITVLSSCSPPSERRDGVRPFRDMGSSFNTPQTFKLIRILESFHDVNRSEYDTCGRDTGRGF